MDLDDRPAHHVRRLMLAAGLNKTSLGRLIDPGNPERGRGVVRHVLGGTWSKPAPVKALAAALGVDPGELYAPPWNAPGRQR